MITREQVADLRPGDVVEYRHSTWPEATTLRGPVYEEGGYLYLGSTWLRDKTGLATNGVGATLTVVSRTPRPLYVNHPRTEPVSGDVARPADGAGIAMFMYRHGNGSPCWRWPNGLDALPGTHDLTLLVDGETGQVVP